MRSRGGQLLQPRQRAGPDSRVQGEAQKRGEHSPFRGLDGAVGTRDDADRGVQVWQRFAWTTEEHEREPLGPVPAGTVEGRDPAPRQHPTESELNAFRGGSGTWENLAWPQNTYSAAFGLRQVWLRTELQLLSEPRGADGSVSPTAATLPFLGSATLYYTIPK